MDTVLSVDQQSWTIEYGMTNMIGTNCVLYLWCKTSDLEAIAECHDQQCQVLQ